MNRPRNTALPAIVRPVVHALLRSADRADDLPAYVRELGGRSGARIFLVGFRQLDPLVVKIGESAAIEREFNNRLLNARLTERLVQLGMNQLGDPVDVVLDSGDTVPWRAIAYPFVGARSYDELENYGDFGMIVRAYVDDKPQLDQQISVATLRACFRLLIQSLQENPSEPAVVLPLDNYLPPVPWEDGIRQVIATISHLLPVTTSLGKFEAWFDDLVSGAKTMVAPLHDHRRLHGDARFANVLVDHLHARVELIDYGNGKDGHLFADLARFEVDLWYRGAPRADKTTLGDAPDPTQVLQTLDIVLSGNGFPNSEDETLTRHARAVAIWRGELLAHVPNMGAAGAMWMYNWFLMVEVLKRIRWLSAGSTEGAGVDGALLLDTIERLRRAVDRTLRSVSAPSWVETPLHLTQLLSCTAAWVPINQHERAANNARNERKFKALRDASAAQGTVRLLAETGQSFLDTGRPFHHDVAKLLNEGGRLHVVVANPFGNEGRAISASYQSREPNPPDLNPEFLAKSRGALRGALSLHASYGDRLEIRVARSGLGASILLTPHAAFFEPYLRLDRDHRHNVLFDTFELLMEPVGSHGGKLLDDHFAFHWREAIPLSLNEHHSAQELLDKMQGIAGGGNA